MGTTGLARKGMMRSWLKESCILRERNELLSSLPQAKLAASAPAGHKAQPAPLPHLPAPAPRKGFSYQPEDAQPLESAAEAGSPETSGSAGVGAQSEGSPPIGQQQLGAPGLIQESPIRGLILPEHPTESRAIAERVDHVLRANVSLVPKAGLPKAQQSPLLGSRADCASRLCSRPLDDVEDSASSCGLPAEPSVIAEPEQTQLLAELEPAQQQHLSTEWPHKVGEDAAALSMQSSSSTSPPDTDSQDEQGEQDSSSAHEGMASSAADGVGAASKAVEGAAVDRAKSMAGSSGDSASASIDKALDVPVPFREHAAGMLFGAAAYRMGAAGLVFFVRVLAHHRLILSGGVVLLAWLAAMRRQGGIVQFLRSVLRAVALYKETVQRLQ